MTDPRIVGDEIANLDEQLQRVINRLKTKGNTLTRGAFLPLTKSSFTPGSDESLSVKRPTQSARAAFDEYVAFGKSAVGVWGVTVGEFKAAGAANGSEMPVFSDGGLRPAAGGAPYPAHHASVWFPTRDDFPTQSAMKRRHERIAQNVVDGQPRRLYPDEVTPV